MQVRKLTSAALLIAIGTLSAHLIYIPAGVSKCFPVQHAINVLGAVLLGKHTRPAHWTNCRKIPCSAT